MFLYQLKLNQTQTKTLLVVRPLSIELKILTLRFTWTLYVPLKKKTSGNPYLKLFDFSQLLVADTTMKCFSRHFSLHPLTALLEHPEQK